MRLYTRTLVTYSHRAGRHRRARARPRHRPRAPPSDGRPDLDVHPARGRPLRERPADHRPATSSTASSGRSPPTSSSAGPRYVVDLLDDPANPYAGPVPGRGRPGRLGLPSIETPDDRTIVFRLRAPQPDFPYVLALPSSSPVPDRGRHRRATTAATRSPPARTRSPRSTRRPASCWTATREWDPATDDVRTALPDQVVVRTGLTGVERDQALLAGSADIDIVRHRRAGPRRPPGSTADEDDPVRGRVDDVTTGAVRLLALPTDVAPMDNPDCRAAVAAAIDRRGGAGGARRAGERGAPLAAVAAGARRRPGGPRPAARPRRRPGVAGGVRPARRLQHRAGGAPTRRPASRSPRRSPTSSPRSASRSEVRPLDAATFYATDVGNPDSVAANGYGIVLATWTADFPTPGVVPGAAGRRPQHPRGRQHQLRPAGRPGGQRAGRRRPRGGRRRRPRGGRSPAAVGRRVGLRAAGRDPGAAGRRAAAAQRRGDAALQRLRPRHRRRPAERSVRLEDESPVPVRRPPSLEKS